jgi:hypothetical protein
MSMKININIHICNVNIHIRPRSSYSLFCVLMFFFYSRSGSGIKKRGEKVANGLNWSPYSTVRIQGITGAYILAIRAGTWSQLLTSEASR